MVKVYYFLHIWHGVKQATKKWELDPHDTEQTRFIIACARSWAEEYPDDTVSVGILRGRTCIGKWHIDDVTPRVLFGVTRYLE